VGDGARIRAQFDAINGPATLEAIAADDRNDLTARAVRFNLTTGRDRLRMAARNLDQELTFLIANAQKTATYRFGSLEPGISARDASIKCSFALSLHLASDRVRRM
jgi:hypothetical protein